MGSASTAPILEQETRLDLRRYGIVKSQTAVATKTASVSVGKPAKDRFYQAHPNPDMRLHIPLMEDKRDFDTRYYLVTEDMQPAVAESRDLTIRFAVPLLSSLGSYMLWIINMTERNGELSGWSSSAMDAVSEATGKWVRIIADTEEGAYTTFVAQNQEALGSPSFPDWSLEKVIALAFKDRIIESLEHPLVKVRAGRQRQ